MKKGAAKWLNQTWMLPSAVFVPAIAIQGHISLSRKISRNRDNVKEYAKDVFTFFVDLEKAYDRVPCEKFWGVLRDYGVDGRLLLAAKSLYSCSEVCVRVERVKSRPFTVGVGLWQGCVLSPLLFIVNPLMSALFSTCWKNYLYSKLLSNMSLKLKCVLFSYSELYWGGMDSCAELGTLVVWASLHGILSF